MDSIMFVIFVIGFIVSYVIFKTAMRERNNVGIIAGYAGMVLAFILSLIAMGRSFGWGG